MDNIIVLAAASGYGGAEKSLELIVGEFCKSYNVTVFTEDKKHTAAMMKNKCNCKVIQLQQGKNPLHVINNLITLYLFLRNKQSFKILVNTHKSAIYLSILTKYTGLHFDNLIVYVRDFQWKYTNFIFKALKDAKFAVPTEALLDKKNYLEGNINSNNIYVTGNPCSIPEEVVTRDEGTSRYILALANIAWWKGLIYLVKAYELSGVLYPLVICGGIGQKDCYDDLINYIKQQNLQNKVIIRGFQNDVNDLYNNCLFVVNSSISEFGGPETFGRTIIEAWSHKKAVISFKCGGPQYLIDDNVNGILVPEKDVKALSDSILLLANNPDKIELMGNQGYKKVKENFKPAKITFVLSNLWKGF